ncbi:MAG: N-formylglutamate amidohydrolase [Pseudorhodoplanes sp.]|uniref:N-formylglutamate amidohydrolase n=1 Tax=Pseudorhodoplanes sp. TaxID=1934341 RepID=UPI003D0B5B4B
MLQCPDIGSELAFANAAGAVRTDNPDGASPLVLCCEHASNHVPSRFDLGLRPRDIERHIAWDPGAYGVARALAGLLDAVLVSSTVSRLVIDCNRNPLDENSIPVISETTVIPGNRELTAAERERRISEVYRPFHTALGAAVDRKEATCRVALVSIHTFNPSYRGVVRPWLVGILFDRDERLSRPLIDALQQRATMHAHSGLLVGINEPYSPKDRVYHTLDRHAQSRGRPNVMIEIRNDLVATAADQQRWGELLGNIFIGILPVPAETSPQIQRT